WDEPALRQAVGYNAVDHREIGRDENGHGEPAPRLGPDAVDEVAQYLATGRQQQQQYDQRGCYETIEHLGIEQRLDRVDAGDGELHADQDRNPEHQVELRRV